MKFFNADDFATEKCSSNQDLADIANEKIEREGKVVYAVRPGDSVWTDFKGQTDKLKAIVINSELIEPCKHPVDKITFYDEYAQGSFGMAWWQCKCGAKVVPTNFTEVK